MRSIPVNRAQLEAALGRAEARGPLRTQTELWKAAAHYYNLSAKERGLEPITFSVVLGRVAEWEITVKTPKARNVTPKFVSGIAPMGPSSDSDDHYETPPERRLPVSATPRRKASEEDHYPELKGEGTGAESAIAEPAHRPRRVAFDDVLAEDPTRPQERPTLATVGTYRAPAPVAPLASQRAVMGLQKVYVPAGSPPASLARFDQDAVHAWCDACVRDGTTHGLRYMASALVYWARMYGGDGGLSDRPKVMDQVQKLIEEYIV